jgi:hypothetical protein
MKPLHPHKGLVKVNMKMKMKTMIKSKRRQLSRGDEDDGDKKGSNSRAKLPHPRVCHIMQTDHPVNAIFGDIEKWVTTRSRFANFYQHYSLVSSFEPFKVEDAIRDPDWVVAMQQELNNFKQNELWYLVERPKQNVVGTKWVFRNKQDEHGVMIRNKAPLVAKGYKLKVWTLMKLLLS